MQAIPGLVNYSLWSVPPQVYWRILMSFYYRLLSLSHKQNSMWLCINMYLTFFILLIHLYIKGKLLIDLLAKMFVNETIFWIFLKHFRWYEDIGLFSITCAECNFRLVVQLCIICAIESCEILDDSSVNIWTISDGLVHCWIVHGIFVLQNICTTVDCFLKYIVIMQDCKYTSTHT